jgi:ribulose 1,5-bisphosphate synthetase/thiazole synthase
MEDEKYQARTERMLSRWAGKQQLVVRQDAGEGQVLRQTPPAPGELDLQRTHYLEPARSIAVLASCEVLVVGAGPAGLSAALAARRAGADVILLERYGCFGGVITTVGMETLAWYRYEGTVESDGIGREMERIAAQMGGTIKWPYNDSPCLDADYFKVVADHLVREAGVRPILHCMAVDVIFDGNSNRIKGIITESKSGRQAVLAQRIIDCTGDADIAHLAGASYRKTPKDKMLGMTTVFSCSGVDKNRFLQYTEEHPATYADWSRTWDQETSGKEDALRSPYLDKEFDEARRLGVIPQSSTDLGGSWSALTEAGEATNLNLAHLKNFDGTDVMDLTQAEMQGRQEALHALVALKKVVPGFENAKLRNFGMTIGCRDSRKIIGRYNLTGDDVRNQAKFADSVGIFPEFIDGYNVLILPTSGRYFEVPYGCMVPLEVDNLLVAGRCVAGDMVSHAAMRNMMACTVTGQAAGVAAAISVQKQVSTAELELPLVQAELQRQGVRIH